MIDDGITKDEHRAMELTADLVDLVTQNIIGFGPTRDQDINEFVADVHRIQNRIMAQAAARSRPDLYRLLGGTPPATQEQVNKALNNPCSVCGRAAGVYCRTDIPWVHPERVDAA